MQMKKLLSLFLALAMLLTLLPALALTASATGPTGNWLDEGNRNTSWGSDYDDVSVFTVHSAGDMARFAALVNGGKNFSGKTVRLAADLDLSAHYWTPIGNSSSNLRHHWTASKGQEPGTVPT